MLWTMGRHGDGRKYERPTRRNSPSWDRTRTLLIQSQACCQLHQGAPKPNTAPSHCSGSRNLTALSAIGSQLEPYHAAAVQQIGLGSPQPEASAFWLTAER